MLRLCSGREKLINLDKTLPPWALNVYMDAAVLQWRLWALKLAPSQGKWPYIPWSRTINLCKPTPTGRAVGRAMSALDLVGPFLVESGGHKWTKNRPINIWVDNTASVISQTAALVPCPPP